MLQTTFGQDVGTFIIRANKSQHNQEIRNIGNTSKMNKTLSKAKKFQKLVKFKKSEFRKINKASRTDFLTFGAKKIFLDL